MSWEKKSAFEYMDSGISGLYFSHLWTLADLPELSVHEGLNRSSGIAGIPDKRCHCACVLRLVDA